MTSVVPSGNESPGAWLWNEGVVIKPQQPSFAKGCSHVTTADTGRMDATVSVIGEGHWVMIGGLVSTVRNERIKEDFWIL